MTTPIERAAAFLEAALATGPVSTSVLFERADEAGIARRTLERAKRQRGIGSRKLGVEAGWVWELVDERPGGLRSEQGEVTSTSNESAEERHAGDDTARPAAVSERDSASGSGRSDRLEQRPDVAHSSPTAAEEHSDDEQAPQTAPEPPSAPQPAVDPAYQALWDRRRRGQW